MPTPIGGSVDVNTRPASPTPPLKVIQLSAKPSPLKSNSKLELASKLCPSTVFTVLDPGTVPVSS